MWPNPDQTDRLLAAAKSGESGLRGERLGTRGVLGTASASRRSSTPTQVLARRVDASDIVQDVLIEGDAAAEGILEKAGHAVRPLALRHLVPRIASLTLTAGTDWPNGGSVDKEQRRSTARPGAEASSASARRPT